MGKVINFPQHAVSNKEMQERAFAAFAAGNNKTAVELYEKYLLVAENNNDPIDATALVQLGQGYINIKQFGDALALVDDYGQQLRKSESGRELILAAGIAAPDFTVIDTALQVAQGTAQAESMQRRAAEFEAQYTREHADVIAQAQKQIAHVGAGTFVDQERVVNEVLPRIPLIAATDAVKRALTDADVFPLMRTTLASWLQRMHLNEEVSVYVYDGLYVFNPSKTRSPFADNTMAQIMTEYEQQFGADLAFMQVQAIKISLIYPALDQIIKEPHVFAEQSINPQKETKYAALQAWMDQQMTIMGQIVNN